MAVKFAVAVVMLLACLMKASLAQPFTVKPNAFAPELGEAAQRAQDNYQGFTFDFTQATGDVTPNGQITSNQVGTNPYLSTLPGDGNGQTLVQLGPCGSNPPHTHPRGSEISFVLYGEIDFAMAEENAGKNAVIKQTIKANTTIHIPQGILHWSFNDNCSPAAFLANFATKDPGTQTMWASLFSVPTHILHAASGLSEADINTIKSLPFVAAPSTGGEECLKRCGLDFKSTNKFITPPPIDY